jgi:hypothetical protein
LAFLLAALVFINLPEELFFMPIRAAERNSYREEQQQLDYLAAHLPSRDTVVAFQGVTYDYFKPRFPRLFNTFYYPRDGSMPIGEVGAIVNCYRGYDGAKGAHLPLPAGIDAAEFRLAEAVPEHVYATILGHRLTNREWGFGCDIYLRNMPAPDEQQSHF